MNKKETNELVDQLYLQANIRFGSVMKGATFHDRNECQGWGRRITAGKDKGQNTISINTYIFREYGVLIGYLLCGKCGKKVISGKSEIPLHGEIEKNLKKADLINLGH